MTAESPLLNVKEAAVLTRSSERTIRRMIHESKLPAFKVGREWRIVLPTPEEKQS